MFYNLTQMVTVALSRTIPQVSVILRRLMGGVGQVDVSTFQAAYFDLAVLGNSWCASEPV